MAFATSKAEQLIQATQTLRGWETEALALYRPKGQQIGFIKSLARLRILRGAPRTGKSLTSFMETASCLTGEPIRISDTETLPFKYPTHRGRTVWTIGFGNDHVSQTIFRMLFTENNGLRIIKDEHTQRWRAWEPNNEYDVAYKEKCRFADPLIPERFIDGGFERGVGWEDKRLNVFSQVKFKNGSMLYAFTSGGAPKKGDPVDLAHVDEDIQFPEHIYEWWSRLADYRGRFIWSVFPESDNDALVSFSRLCEEEVGKPEPLAEEFVLRFRDNDYIDDKTKAEQMRVFEHAGEAVAAARGDGEFTFNRTLVYPTFHTKVHTRRWCLTNIAAMRSTPSCVRIPNRRTTGRGTSFSTPAMRFVPACSWRFRRRSWATTSSPTTRCISGSRTPSRWRKSVLRRWPGTSSTTSSWICTPAGRLRWGCARR